MSGAVKRVSAKISAKDLGSRDFRLASGRAFGNQLSAGFAGRVPQLLSSWVGCGVHPRVHPRPSALLRGNLKPNTHRGRVPLPACSDPGRTQRSTDSRSSDPVISVGSGVSCGSGRSSNFLRPEDVFALGVSMRRPAEAMMRRAT